MTFRHWTTPFGRGQGTVVTRNKTIGNKTISPAAREMYERAIKQYQPGGGYTAGIEAGLERGETKAVSGGMQSLISAGLGGTTQPAGLSKKYQEEVGAPARAKAETERARGQASLQSAMADMYQQGFQAAQERAQRGELTYAQISSQEATAAANRKLGYAKLTSNVGLEQQKLSQQQSQFEETMDYKYAQLGSENNNLTAHTVSDSIYSDTAPAESGGGSSAYMPVGYDQKPLTNLQTSMFELGHGPVSQQGAKEVASSLNKGYKYL